MKKILVIRYGALGDLIVTFPVFQSLEKSGYSVVLAGNGRFRDFLLQYGHVDEFVPVDGNFFLPLFAGASEDSVCRYLEKFSLILAYADESEPFSAGLKKSFSGRIIFHPADPSKIREHVISYLLKPVRDIAACIRDIPEIKIDRPAHGECFVIHPGSGSLHKNWPREKFAGVYARLSEEKEGYVLLGHVESYMRSFWLKKVPSNKIIDCPDMKSLMNLVGKTGLYIGNDSGISHLFTAAGVTSTVIFGPTSPSIWSPRGKNVRIVYKKTDCSPCDAIRRKLCKEKNCLGSITISDVIGVAGEFYGNKRND